MTDDRLCIKQTLANKAVTQVAGYNFNSFTNHEGQVIAANEDGLFLLGGANTFAGTQIDAYFEVIVDFGSVVRLRNLWVNLETDGPLTITITFDEKTASANSLTLTPEQSGQHRVKVPGQRDDKGSTMRIKIANSDGSDFSVDSIDAVLVNMGSRRTL